MSRFVEIQRFPLWADLLMLGIGVAMPLAIWLAGERDPKAAQVFAWVHPGTVLVWVGLFRMKTEVGDGAVTVTFGWIPTYRRRIALADILSAEPIQYNPIRDFGGWGIRGIPVSGLNARGNLGVQLKLRDGRGLMIGSQVPTELAQAIRTAQSIH